MHPCAPLVRKLDGIGLRQALLATKCGGRLTAYRVVTGSGKLSLTSLGDIDGRGYTCIGRVAAPDPLLDLRWPETLTFYGRWFDELAGADRRGGLRRKIARAPLATLLHQIQRDDRYAVVGTYYAVFRRILEAKQRLPLVLLDTSLLEMESLPVLLAPAQDEARCAELACLLQELIQPACAAADDAVAGEVGLDALEDIAVA